MKITKLLGKNGRIQVFIDEKYSFSCSVNFLLENQLQIGQVLTDEELEALRKKAVESIIKTKLIEYSTSRNYSENELFRKINSYTNRKYQISTEKEIFHKHIEDLKKSRIYSEKQALANLVNVYKYRSKGKNYISSKLMQKGFNKTDIKEELSALGEEDFQEKLKAFLKSKKASLEKKETDPYKLKQKLVQAALAKGFSYGEIKRAIKNQQTS